MKKPFFLLTLLAACTALSLNSAAQACDGQRYYSILFPAYDSTTLVYATDSMTMDLYRPLGDTAIGRRCLMMIHGGNFYEGSSTDPFIYFICRRYVSRGYVVASINYPLISPAQSIAGAIYDSTTAYPIIAQTISDGEAAVRYLKKNAATLGIDSSWIAIGGEATGALIADHIAYLRSGAGLSPLLDSAFAALGGLQGNGGNPGYSTNVKAVLNFEGGLLSTAMITSQYPVPCFTAQGDSDHVIPFNCDYPFNYRADYTLCGGAAMQQAFNSLGITNLLQYYDSLDSEPWNDTSYSGPLQGRYIGSMVDSLSALFLYKLDCPGFTAIQSITATRLNLFPNPAGDHIFLQSDAAIETVEIIDLSGRKLKTFLPGEKPETTMDLADLSSGLYWARIIRKDQTKESKAFVKQ